MKSPKLALQEITPRCALLKPLGQAKTGTHTRQFDPAA